MKTIVLPAIVIITLIMMTQIIGCRDDDQSMQQIVDLSQQVIADQQATMESMQRNSEKLSIATENLISADAQARKELVAASKEQNAGFAIARRNIDQMRADVVAEQRSIATQRHRDPILAQTIGGAALTFSLIIPLAVCWLLIRGANNTPVEHETLEALLLEMSGETNQFGPHPQQARKRISTNTPLPTIGDSK
jgi:hypothetical protein